MPETATVTLLETLQANVCNVPGRMSDCNVSGRLTVRDVVPCTAPVPV